MKLRTQTVEQAIREEIAMHAKSPAKGGLRGTSGRSSDWEDGYIQGLNQVVWFILPACSRQELEEPELAENLPSNTKAINFQKRSNSKTNESPVAVIDGSADDHSGLRKKDVVQYLRSEACRDFPDHVHGSTLQGMMRVIADYLDRAEQTNTKASDGDPT